MSIQLAGVTVSPTGNVSLNDGTDKVLVGTPALLLLAATAAFWIVPEWLAGATLGKWLFRIRVTSLEGQDITLTQSLKRNLLRLVDFFPFYLTGFLLVALTPSHQRLGDLWAKTIVVPRKSQGSGPGE